MLQLDIWDGFYNFAIVFDLEMLSRRMISRATCFNMEFSKFVAKYGIPMMIFVNNASSHRISNKLFKVILRTVISFL